MVTPPLRDTSAGRSVRLHATEVIATIGVSLVAAALVVLVWLIEARSVQAETDQQRARAEARVGGQSLLLAEQVHRDMLGVEQSLRILRAGFAADPDHFDMNAWRQRMPALTDLADDAFIADPQSIIRHAINQAEVGVGLGARVRGMFRPQTDRPDAATELATGFGMQVLQTQEHELLMLLKAEHPDGWLVGVAYRMATLKRLFAEANLGVQGMTALIETRAGRVDAVVGPAAANPNYDIAQSAMYAAMQERPDGTWVGPSAPDGVRRIHGFHRIPGHPFAVVVAIDETEAMESAIAWQLDVGALAWAATIVVLAAAGVALYAVWTFRSKRRLRQALQRELILVNNAQAELAEARERLGGRAGQVQALFAAVDEGVLVLDADLHLVEWNAMLPALLGIAPETLRPGLPFDEVLRSQAREGAFGARDDIEAEVGRRLALIRSGSTTYPGPGERPLVMFRSSAADGSVLLVLRPASEYGLPPAPAEPATETL